MGLGAVINVVTKEKQNGGSVGINTQNAVTTGFGNNVVNFKYNWGNSQIGVTYNINYRNYNKRILDEEMAYSVGGTDYQKTKADATARMPMNSRWLKSVSTTRKRTTICSVQNCHSTP